MERVGEDSHQVDTDLLDAAVLAELTSTVGAERLIVFSEAVRTGCHEALAELRHAADAADQVATIAHRLKGLVGNLGLVRLSEIASELERSEAWSRDARLTAIARFEALLDTSLAAFQSSVKQ